MRSSPAGDAHLQRRWYISSWKRPHLQKEMPRLPREICSHPQISGYVTLLPVRICITTRTRRVGPGLTPKFFNSTSSNLSIDCLSFSLLWIKINFNTMSSYSRWYLWFIFITSDITCCSYRFFINIPYSTTNITSTFKCFCC